MEAFGVLVRSLHPDRVGLMSHLAQPLADCYRWCGIGPAGAHMPPVARPVLGSG